jgi:hypothetical protein
MPPRAIDPCPSCSSPLVTIELSPALAMRSCSVCEQRWWRRDGDETAFTGVRADVRVLGARRRAS